MKSHFLLPTTRRSATVFLPLCLAAAFFVACQPQKPVTEQVLIKPVQTEEIMQVTGIARVEPESKIIALSAESNGIVTAVRVQEGATVRAGDVILELERGIESTQLDLSKSRIPSQTASVTEAQTAVNAADARIETARARLQALQVGSEATKVRMNRLRILVEKGAEIQQNYDNAKADYDAAAQNIRAAQADIEGAIKDRDRARAAVNTTQVRTAELQAQVKVSEATLAQRFVRAPANGTLLSLDVRPGNNISPTTAIGDFAPEGATIAICEVDELFATRVQKGQKAYIRTVGMNDTLSTGTVVYAASYLKKKSLFSADAGELEDRRVREVRIKLDKPQGVLLGARVDYVILLK